MYVTHVIVSYIFALSGKI